MNDQHYIDRLDTIAANALKDSLPVYAKLVAVLKEIIASSTNETHAKELIAKFESSKLMQKLSFHFYDVLHTCDALGRSNIVDTDIEASKIANIVAKEIPAMLWFVCDDAPVKISFDLVPKDALKYLQEKSIKLAGVELEELKESVKQSLIKAINDGKTFAHFKNEVDAVFDQYGVTNLSQLHLETVYRTNTFAAYSIGQQNQFKTMQDRFPIAQLIGIHDARERIEHRLNEGYYNPSTVPIPPYDYNCRCTIRYIHISQINGKEQPFWESPPAPSAIIFDQRDSM